MAGTFTQIYIQAVFAVQGRATFYKRKNITGKRRLKPTSVSKGLTTKKESERRPRSPATHRGCLENLVGEEAPEARVGPRNRRKPVRRPERP